MLLKSNFTKSHQLFEARCDGAGRSCRAGRSIVWVVVTIAALALCLLLVASAYFLTATATPVAIPVPNPNGYEQMVRLGKSIQGEPPRIDEADAETMADFLNSNAHGIAELNAIIQKDSVVPVEYSSDYLDKILSTELTNIRQAHRLRHAEARLAELEDRPADAASSYVKLIAAARRAQFGGLLIHVQVSNAYENVAWTNLAKLADQLSETERANVLGQVGTLPPRETGHIAREQTLATKRLGRIRTFLMKKQSQAVYEQEKAMSAESHALEKNAVSRLQP